jgi:hypothetical protein
MPDTSSDSSFRPAWKRIGLIAAASLLGVVGGYYGQPWIHDNDRAINVIVTAFSILAGFLVAIMTIVADPSAFARRSWRAHEFARSAVYNKLRRQRYLFLLYLATLSAIFLESLIPKHWSLTITWVERIYFGMAIAAFVISFGLPETLMQIQLERFDHAIESRRKPEGDVLRTERRSEP